MIASLHVWTRGLGLLLSVAAVCAVAGCATLLTTSPLETPWPWESDEEEPVGTPPNKLVAIWSSAMLTAPGQAATRGFGGRIYFYDAESKPTEVSGTLMVYAFDDTHRAASTQRPQRKYVFKPEQLQDHRSEGRLGVSYSVWLPWDAADGPQREISLLPILLPEGGQPLVGDQSRQLLSGNREEPAENAAAGGFAASGVRPIAHFTPATESTPLAEPRMQSSTFPVSSNMQRQLANGPASTSSTRPSSWARLNRQSLAPAAPNPAGLSQPPEATAAPTGPASPPPVHSGFDRRPVPAERAARPWHGRPRWQPFPAAQTFRPQGSPPTPSAGQSPGFE